MSDRILTEDERKMLEGLAPFNLNSTVRYIPKPYASVPDDLKVTFTVRPFKKNEQDTVRRTIAKISDADENKLREYARSVIVGMENLHDAATGEPIEFKADAYGSIDRNIFELIPVTIMSDILMYVCKISGLIAAEKSGL